MVLDKDVQKCMNQVFKFEMKVRLPGWGDCSICTPNDENKKCDGYRPAPKVKVRVYNVK